MNSNDGDANSGPYSYRKNVSFAEAEGVVDPPPQLQLREISRELRAKLWSILYLSIIKDVVDGPNRQIIKGDWLNVFVKIHVNINFGMIDEFNANPENIKEKLKEIIVRGNYIQIFDLIQNILRFKNNYWVLGYQIGEALKSSRSAYRVIDGNTIVPFASETDFETFERSLSSVSTVEFGGARSHLLQAASDLATGKFADSVRESISAVESIARVLTNSSSMGEALNILEREFYIHPSLKKGFGAVYGYTSDEQGIRHAMLDAKKSNVDEADALFMLGSCSAFITYLIMKKTT